MTKGKPWYTSRTLWVAIAQAAVGIVVAASTDPNIGVPVGIGALLKSVLDFYLRKTTTDPVAPLGGERKP